MPALEHLGRSLLRPKQHACIELANREQFQLELCNDAEATATAAHRPKQVGLATGVGAESLAVGSNNLGSPDAVGGQPVPADHPARAATERVAGHAYVGRRPRQSRQPMLGGRPRDVLPLRARLQPRAAAIGVDLDGVHGRHVDKHASLE